MRTLNELTKAIQKSRENFVKNFDVDEFVDRTLSTHAKEILGKMMGFDNHWGQWEVDHCNGRHEQSIIGKMMQEKAAKAVTILLEDALKNLTLTPAQIKAARAEYRNRLLDILSHRARGKAEEETKELIEKVLTFSEDDTAVLTDMEKENRRQLYEELKAEFEEEN